MKAPLARMKLRNQLLALVCLGVFAALGYAYVQLFVVQKPFGIILFISDGMVARHLTMARLYEGGADHHLALESFPRIALLRNAANDFAVPDDAATATALATGFRGDHRVLSCNASGAALPTLADLARRAGRSFGVVTNGELTGPVPAAFYAHATDAREREGLALQMVEKLRPEVALGGGEVLFLPRTSDAPQAPGRHDGRDLVAELQKSGVEIVHTRAELENLPSYHPAPILGFFAPRALAFADQIESSSRQPSLADMVRRAIGFLQQTRNGYLLVVDASLVGAAAEMNQGERTISETLALDRALSMAVQCAGRKSLILAVGKHSTGGLSLNGYPLRQDHGMALLGANAAGYPYLTWATGPNGPSGPPNASSLPLTPPSGVPSASPSPLAGNARTEPAAFQAASGMNNAEDVLAIGTGRGSDAIGGFLDNTAIFRILKGAL